MNKLQALGGRELQEALGNRGLSKGIDAGQRAEPSKHGAKGRQKWSLCKGAL
jgi:hypothetical protein